MNSRMVSYDNNDCIFKESRRFKLIQKNTYLCVNISAKLKISAKICFVKLLTQLCGDRLLIANATGCSSIYGGNLPTTPYCQRADGRGPAWSNSLFEDNAQFGLGMRVSADKLYGFAMELVDQVIAAEGAPAEFKALCEKIKAVDQFDEKGQGVEEMRKLVAELKVACKAGIEAGCEVSKQLITVADNLVRKSVWIVGGDGWAYDIGYGGLDHVLASGENVNILVLDSEVYSNTGGQRSKATPIGASAKFATSGSQLPRKDLAMIAASSGGVYVGTISLGAKDAHALQVMNEAESFNGPSLIIAYSHCISHGFDIGTKGLEHQKMAVDTGLWNLFRYDPRRKEQGLNPFVLDSKPTLPVADLMATETRFKFVRQQNPERYEELVKKSQAQIDERVAFYTKMAEGN